MAMKEARVALLPRATAPAMGRRFLEGLSDRVPAMTLGDARLLLSEVLTNAIRHSELEGDDTISLHIRAASDELVVEVSNPGPGFDQRDPAVGTTGDSGWGLVLLDRIADGWGVEGRPDGAVVWFRLRLPDLVAA